MLWRRGRLFADKLRRHRRTARGESGLRGGIAPLSGRPRRQPLDVAQRHQRRQGADQKGCQRLDHHHAHGAGHAADDGAEAVAERLAGATSIARTQMERNLGFLGTVGNNAPFVGLLGTVIGVIRAFHALDESAGKVTSGLMAEVGEALVATAIGLLVALPAVAFFNFFQRLIRYRLTWADALGRDLLAHLKGLAHREKG